MKHGGDLGQAIETFGGEYDEWIDLSTGINPFSYQLEDPPARTDGDTRLPDWQDDMRAKLVTIAAQLDHVLEDSGLNVAGGTDLFRLVNHPDAERLHAHLASAKIWIRKFSDAPELLRLGLPAGQLQLGRLRDALATRPS